MKVKNLKMYEGCLIVVDMVNGFVEEMVSGQRVVQVFNHEEENINEFQERNNKYKANFEKVIICSM